MSTPSPPVVPLAPAARRDEAQGRGVRAPVRTARAQTRDAIGGRVDSHGGIRRTHRMGARPVHHDGHDVLVAGAVVRSVDIPRPIYGQQLRVKVNTPKDYFASREKQKKKEIRYGLNGDSCRHNVCHILILKGMINYLVRKKTIRSK